VTAPRTYLREMRDAQARRRLEVAKLVRDTPKVTDTELAKALNVDRCTIREDRRALMAELHQDAKTETQIYRDDQLARIMVKWEEIEYDVSMSSAEKHLAMYRWMKLETHLRGTAAPSRSIVASIALDGVGPYREFVSACHGLEAEQMETLLKLAREMPRREFEQVDPPLSSSLWLTEGEPDATA
jgi:hypothetical protein